ncbi:MAG: hypothetical protein WBP41_09060 [Saprospiraceae bacterium]
MKSQVHFLANKLIEKEVKYLCSDFVSKSEIKLPLLDIIPTMANDITAFVSELPGSANNLQFKKPTILFCYNQLL